MATESDAEERSGGLVAFDQWMEGAGSTHVVTDMQFGSESALVLGIPRTPGQAEDGDAPPAPTVIGTPGGFLCLLDSTAGGAPAIEFHALTAPLTLAPSASGRTLVGSSAPGPFATRLAAVSGRAEIGAPVVLSRGGSEVNVWTYDSKSRVARKRTVTAHCDVPSPAGGVYASVLALASRLPQSPTFEVAALSALVAAPPPSRTLRLLDAVGRARAAAPRDRIAALLVANDGIDTPATAELLGTFQASAEGLVSSASGLGALSASAARYREDRDEPLFGLPPKEGTARTLQFTDVA